MASRVAACLGRLIEPDWGDVTWYRHHGYDDLVVTVMAPGWSWTGTMSDKDWHRLMQLAINKLGKVPEVKVLQRERVAS